MRRAALVLLVFGCARALPVAASEESQALAARGLIELNAGHTPQALELFDKAVAADPSDSYARYQRGVTRAKLGDEPGAIDDLRAALAARPDFPQAALELGIALTDTGQYQDAEPLLLQAQLQPTLDAQASFFLGIAQLRLERYSAARQSFARARTRDPSLDLSAQYYEGVIAYQEHDLSTAEALFTTVEQANPSSAMGRESTQFLGLIRRGRSAAYSAWGTVALEYDSNVTLGPSTTTPGGISGKGDGRVALDAGGTYVPWTSGPASLAVSYEFFQSLQFHLTDFNLEDHRPAVQLMFDFGRVVVGVLGRYDYYLLSTYSFLQEGTAYPWVALREEGIGRTEIYDRLQRRDYKRRFVPGQQPAPNCEGPQCEGFEQLDGFYNYTGVRQVIDLGGPNRELSFGYQLAGNHPVDQGNDIYQYVSNQFEVALRWPLPYSITGEAGYQFEIQQYAAASSTLPPAGGQRQDHDHRAVVSFERPLSEIYDHLFLNASWYGTFNNSDKPDFEYERQIGSIGAEVRF